MVLMTYFLTIPFRLSKFLCQDKYMDKIDLLAALEKAVYNRHEGVIDVLLRTKRAHV